MNQDQLREQIREALGSVQDLIAVNTGRQVHYRLSSAVEAVTAVVAPLLAERRAVEQRLIGELADTRGRLGETQGNLWEAREQYARANKEIDQLRREVEFEANGTTGGDREAAEMGDVAGIVYEFGNLNDFLAGQVTEKLFEFFGIFPKQPAPTRPVCVCAVGDPGPRWSLLRCSVHPDGGDR